MKKTNLILGIALSIVAVSCSNKALDYNNKIVKYDNDIAPIIEKLNSIVLSEDTTAAAATMYGTQLDSLTKVTETKLSEINKMEVPKGGEKMHNTFVKEYEVVISMCKNMATLIDRNKATPEDKLAAKDAFDKTQESTTALVEEMKAEQLAFAKANNFKLEKEK